MRSSPIKTGKEAEQQRAAHSNNKTFTATHSAIKKCDFYCLTLASLGLISFQLFRIYIPLCTHGLHLDIKQLDEFDGF